MRTLYLSIICFALLTTPVHSQEYYRVNDSDGYVNLRLKPDINSKVIQKINNTECLVALYAEGNWIKAIHFSLSKKILVSGFIHNSRLLKDETCKTAQNVKAIPQGDIAMESLDFHKNFEHAFKWYVANQQLIVDDGYYAEGYSDYVMRSLANSFSPNVSVLNELSTKHPDFIAFILKHIDPTGSQTDLESIVSNQGNCALIIPATICNQVIANAKMSLDNLLIKTYNQGIKQTARTLANLT